MSRDRFRQPFLPAWETRPGAAGRDDCFADEIDIDFPSVGALVRRVRDAFLGEGADGQETLTTQVLLSRREASRGTIVPLDVPLRGLCACCGGRGEVWTEPCTACCGSGDAFVHHPVRLSVPPGVADGARLRFRVRSPHAKPVRVEVRVAVRTTAA